MPKFKNLSSFVIAAVFLAAAQAWPKTLKVVTTTPDLASVAREVGGSGVKVESLASGVQDPHFVDAKPSLIVKLMSADLFIETGLELEVGWAPLLVQSSGNSRIQANSPGFLDASAAVSPLEVPQNPNRSLGDVHPGGNPHYMMDPENAGRVTKLIADRMADLDPADGETFHKNAAAFETKLNEALKRWTRAMAPYQGAKLVSYHRDVTYFVERFGLVSIGEIEPKPGIPPTASHTADVIERMKAQKARLILTEPWHEPRTPESIARAAGANVVTLALFPGGAPDAKDYLSTLEYDVQSVMKALGTGAP